MAGGFCRRFAKSTLKIWNSSVDGLGQSGCSRSVGVGWVGCGRGARLRLKCNASRFYTGVCSVSLSVQRVIDPACPTETQARVTDNCTTPGPYPLVHTCRITERDRDHDTVCKATRATRMHAPFRPKYAMRAHLAICVAPSARSAALSRQPLAAVVLKALRGDSTIERYAQALGTLPSLRLLLIALEPVVSTGLLLKELGLSNGTGIMDLHYPARELRGVSG